MMKKAVKERRALEVLEQESWARQLVRRVKSRPDDEPTLFELRWAYEAHRRGIDIDYEWPTGVCASSVDFRLRGSPSWNVELVSPQVSDAVQDATSVEWPDTFVSIETTALGFDDGDWKATPGHELLRLQRVVSRKMYDGSAPTKFPVPDGSAFNVIVVDTRAFLGGDADVDRDDLSQFAYGPSAVAPMKVSAVGKDELQPLHGLFEVGNPFPAARIARERIHLLIAVHEQSFDEDEIQQTMTLFPNFGLLDAAQARRFPLRPPNGASTDLRDENPLWNDG
jgi:hypothetical protein